MKSTNSRLMGVAAATILALLGGYLLYQNSGDSESEAAERPVELVDVLVAVQDIERGQPASSLAENAYAYVLSREVPADQVNPGALTSVADLDVLSSDGSVTSGAIEAGLQLTASNFVVPGSQTASPLPDVDPTLFEFTIAIEPQRAVGGTVRVGQYVAVVGSFDPGEGGQARETVVVADQVLVTNVQTEQLLSDDQLDIDPLAPSLAPSSRLLVTLGVNVDQLEKLAYTAEYARIWLARQGIEATVFGSEIRDRAGVVISLAGQGPRGTDLTGSTGG
jgi:pilus assembly protein CpaB